MSIIHSTFNSVNTGYTVVGGNQSPDNSSGMSALLLSRGGRPYRCDLYKELSNLNIHEILSIEVGSKSHYDLEKEAVKYNNLKFLILQDEVSIGEMINIGITESTNENIFVIWDDVEIDSKAISYRVLDKIVEDNRLCTVPNCRTKEKEIVPTLMTPLFDKDLLKVVPLFDNEELKTVFPYMYMGIYNKELFVRLGGYDIDIMNKYWQKLDFGLRAHMWGEHINSHKALVLTLGSNGHDIEDITPDGCYRLYNLKNLSVNVNREEGYIPFRRFFIYYEKSGLSLVNAYKTFKLVRTWVKINRFRFKYSVLDVINNWNKQ